MYFYNVVKSEEILSMKDDAIVFDNLCFSYGNNEIFKDINLVIHSDEIFSFLGRSGCGKTTLLRLISGLSKPTRGNVLVFGKEASSYGGETRCVATVWQSKALFPHMTVRSNIEFGLKVRNTKKSLINKMLYEVVEQLGLNKLLERNVKQLSGGEQQRVALARALIVKPKILLLDEPFTGLDKKLKLQLQADLKDIQYSYGCTFVLVSHLLKDIFSLAHRMAVLDKKSVQQIGEPKNIYHNPKNIFVADFIGNNNIIPCIVNSIEDENTVGVVSDYTAYYWKAKNKLKLSTNNNDKAYYIIGYEDIRLDSKGDCKAEVVFRASETDGRRNIYYFKYGKEYEIRVKLYYKDENEIVKYSRGEKVAISWSSENAYILIE